MKNWCTYLQVPFFCMITLHWHLPHIACSLSDTNVGSYWESDHLEAGVQDPGPPWCGHTCHPGGHSKLHTDVAACTLCVSHNGWCFILLKESGLLAIPSSRSRGMAIHVEGPELVCIWLFHHIKLSIKSHHWGQLEVRRAVMCILTYVPLIYF